MLFRSFYTAPQPTIVMHFRAALGFGPSVMYQAGIALAPQDFYKDVTVASVVVTETAYERLLKAIGADFDRQGAARACPRRRDEEVRVLRVAVAGAGVRQLGTVGAPLRLTRCLSAPADRDPLEAGPVSVG